MKCLRSGLLTIAAAALSVTFANAQYGPPPGNLYSAHWVTGLIDHVHDDLNRAYSSWQFSNRDRKNLDHAEHQLQDFASKWERGRFNKGELDDSISAIRHVVENNHMPQGNREALIDDLGRLRSMREAYDRHEIGGR
jgi:hypothetical protein